MVELTQEHKVVRTPICYFHHIKNTYPKENVKNNLAAWKERVQQCKEFLAEFEENKRKALIAGENQLDHEIESVKKRAETLKAMTREARAEQLLKEFDSFIEQQEKIIAELNHRKKELKHSIEQEMAGYKHEHEQELQRKQEAIDLWSNPVDE